MADPGVFFLLVINGLAFLELQAKKINADVQEFGADSPQVTQRVQKVLDVSIIEATAL